MVSPPIYVRLAGKLFLLCMVAFALSFIGLEWAGALDVPEDVFDDDPMPPTGGDAFGPGTSFDVSFHANGSLFGLHDEVKPLWAAFW